MRSIKSHIRKKVNRSLCFMLAIMAGLAANAWGAPFSVVSGGIACLLATAWVAWQTPALRAYRRETPVITEPIRASS